MIKSFTDLQTWQYAHALSLMIYEVTDHFPKSEIFSLTSQLRRAAISVSSNLAEGFGRRSAKDRQHFYQMASGSLYEIKSQVLLAKDLGYIPEGKFQKLSESLNQAHKLINGLLRSHVT